MKAKASINGIAVFLDRDGTINEDVGYLSDPGEIVLIPGAAEAVRALNRAGVKVIVVTNQSGVARGYFTEEGLSAVNERLKALMAGEGARFDAVYYCPHHPDEGCRCRKPETGLVVKAASELSIDLKRSYMVGDKASDVKLARKAGSRGILVLTGEGRRAIETLEEAPDFVAGDIRGAVEWILEDLKRSG